MKGQYLAIESILTLGMGLAIATGTITLFSDYRTNVLTTGEGKQALTVNSRVQAAVNDMKSADKAERTVDLPETIGGSSYRISADSELLITTNDETYTFQISDSGYDYQGSVDGGSIKLFKRDNQIQLRPG